MDKIHIEVHKALHNPKQKQVKINGTPTEIKTNPDGLRYVVFKDSTGKEWEVVQQNPKTASSYAQRVREGEKISWLIPYYFGLRNSQGWKVITDSTSPDAV